MPAFAPGTREVVVEGPTGRADLELTLLSRTQQAARSQQRPATATRANRGFQSLSVMQGLAAAAKRAGGGADQIVPSGMPVPGRGSGRGHGVGVIFRQHLRRGHVRHEHRRTRPADARGPRTGRLWRRPGRTGLRWTRRAGRRRWAGGGPGGGGAPGGGFGGFGGGGGRGGPMVLGGGGRFDINRPHGSVYYSVGDSALDAAPYALTDSPVDKASYMRQRFGASLGGPLNIPGIYKGGSKTFFFVNYNGSRGRFALYGFFLRCRRWPSAAATFPPCREFSWSIPATDSRSRGTISKMPGWRSIQRRKDFCRSSRYPMSRQRSPATRRIFILLPRRSTTATT